MQQRDSCILDKSKDRFIAIVLFAITATCCVTASPEVFVTNLEVTTYELIFITTVVMLFSKELKQIKPDFFYIRLLPLFVFLLILITHLPYQWATDNYPVIATFRVFSLVIHLFFLLLLVFYLNRSALGLWSLFYGLIFSLTLISLLYYSESLGYLTTVFDNDHPIATANIRHIGFLAVTASIASAGCLLNSCHLPALRWLFFLSTVINFSFVIWLGSRTGVAVTFVCLGLFTLWTTFMIKKNKRATLLLIAAMALSVLLANLLTVQPEHGPERFKQQFSQMINGTQTDLSSGRVALWKEAVSRGSVNPFFGTGAESYFLNPNGDKSSYMHPHNLPLLVYIETGLVGLICISLLVIPLLKTSYQAFLLKSVKETGEINALLICIALLLLSLTSGSLYYSQTLYIFCGTIAILISLRKSSD